MLTQIDVECDQPIPMSVLGARPRDSLILQQVTGLGPPEKSLFVGDYSRDGGVYGGRRVATRNPVLTIKVNPNFSQNETVDGWRDILYRAFNDPYVPGTNPYVSDDTDGDAVSLLIYDDIKPLRVLTGYTETFAAETFSADNVIQVSMICPDPYIRDAAETVVTPPSGTPGWQTVPFTYAGTAEVGFEVTINVTTATTTLTLDNNGQLMVLTYSPFQVGDVVYINTKPGERQITLTRGGVNYDLAFALYSESPWLKLHSMSNSLQVYGASTSNIVANISNLTYTQFWWGV